MDSRNDKQDVANLPNGHKDLPIYLRNLSGEGISMNIIAYNDSVGMCVYAGEKNQHVDILFEDAELFNNFLETLVEAFAQTDMFKKIAEEQHLHIKEAMEMENIREIDWAKELNMDENHKL